MKMSHVGARIRIYRKKKKMSQEKLASLCKISRQVISAYETGREIPRLDKAIKIANILNISIEFLCYGKDSNSMYHNTYAELLQSYCLLLESYVVFPKINKDSEEKELLLISKDPYFTEACEQINNIRTLYNSLTYDTYQRAIDEILNSYKIKYNKN